MLESSPAAPLGSCDSVVLALPAHPQSRVREHELLVDLTEEEHLANEETPSTGSVGWRLVAASIDAS
jgi:hypothetical protein